MFLKDINYICKNDFCNSKLVSIPVVVVCFSLDAGWKVGSTEIEGCPAGGVALGPGGRSRKGAALIAGFRVFKGLVLYLFLLCCKQSGLKSSYLVI